MIDWKPSLKLDTPSIEEFKDYLKKHPNSHKRVIRICDVCGDKSNVAFNDNTDLCFLCANRTPERREAARLNAIKHQSTPEARAANTARQLKEKDPLPLGQEIQIPKNKDSPQYIGCIAEEVLAKTFKNVRRMPPNNHGYDFICNKDFKIDVKSGATGHKGYWAFHIYKNKVADYFLCLAFESKDDLTHPSHLWLIPGKDVNHKVGAQISKSTLHKWKQYEQSIDRVSACCDTMISKNL